MAKNLYSWAGPQGLSNDDMLRALGAAPPSATEPPAARTGRWTQTDFDAWQAAAERGEKWVDDPAILAKASEFRQGFAPVQGDVASMPPQTWAPPGRYDPFAEQDAQDARLVQGKQAMGAIDNFLAMLGKYGGPGVNAASGPSSGALAQNEAPVNTNYNGGLNTPITLQDARNMQANGRQASAPQDGGVTPMDNVRARAQALADARLRNQIQPQTNAWDNFGLGGGDWASAWQNATRPTSGLFGELVGRQLAGPQSQSGMAGLFNSASGPYGQLQAAAAYTAPARAEERARKYEADTDRDIARIKSTTAGRVASQLMNMIGQPMTGLQTDYGASARLKPVDFRRFIGR